MFTNGKLGSLYDWTLPKLHMISKKASNKRCLELNSFDDFQKMAKKIITEAGWWGMLDGYQLIPFKGEINNPFEEQ